MRPTEFTALASMVTAEVRNAGLGQLHIQGFGALHDRTRFLRRHDGWVTIWLYTGRSAATIGADMVDGVAAAYPDADPGVLASLRRAVTDHVALDDSSSRRPRRPVWRSRPTQHRLDVVGRDG